MSLQEDSGGPSQRKVGLGQNKVYGLLGAQGGTGGEMNSAWGGALDINWGCGGGWFAKESATWKNLKGKKFASRASIYETMCTRMT